MALIFINSEEEINKIPLLYHYTKLERACDEIKKHYLWFSNPILWMNKYDPFFFTSWYSTENTNHIFKRHPLMGHVFGMSFHISPLEYKDWKYVGGSEPVEIEFKNRDLLDFLNSLDTLGYDVVIGKVSQFDIPAFANTMKELSHHPFTNLDYLRLMFYVNSLKKDHDEIRMFIVPKNWETLPPLRSNVTTENLPPREVISGKLIKYNILNEAIINCVSLSDKDKISVIDFMKNNNITENPSEFADNFEIENGQKVKALTYFNMYYWKNKIKE